MAVHFFYYFLHFFCALELLLLCCIKEKTLATYFYISSTYLVITFLLYTSNSVKSCSQARVAYVYTCIPTAVEVRP